MSVKIMSRIFETECFKPTERLILLALADHANDEGECYPSIARLCYRTGLSERAVQNNIRLLKASGFLEIEAGGGRKNCNLYRIKTPHEMHPAPDAPPHLIPETPHIVTINPAPDAPEPSRTIIEPSLLPPISPPAVFQEIRKLLEQWVTPQAAESFIAYRKRHKSKGLTLTAAKRLSNSLSEILIAGYDPTDALGLAEERGWSSVNLDWYEKSKGNRNENRPSNYGCNQPRRNGDGSATIEAFADVARRRAQGCS